MGNLIEEQNTNPLVSIIIPTYNSERFVAASIESAISQTWVNKEIIVIDDGSTDNSFEIAKAYESRGPVKVYKQDNSGSAAARNTGFRNSKGDYIQYLDADDLLSQDKIKCQLEMLKQLSPGIVTSCSWGRFSESIEDSVFVFEDVWKDMRPVDWLVSAWKGGGMMQTACWLTPRFLIEKAGPWDESLKRNPSDDGEFFCRVLLNSTGIKFCADAKVFYRAHQGLRVSAGINNDAVRSLLGTCISYEKSMFAVEKSTRTIDAVASNYATFIYRFYETFPDYSKEAELRIKKLGVKSIRPVGGKYFLILAFIIGFKNALRLRAFLQGKNRM